MQGKTVIVVRDGPGFYTTRVLAAMIAEALNLVDDGADVRSVDRALVHFGFPVGPVALIDEVGIDVAVHIMSGQLLEHFQKTRTEFKVPIGLAEMYKAGYAGKKNGRGFYAFDKRGKRRSDSLNHGLAKYFLRMGTVQIPDQQIVQRVILSLLAEAALCLQEGILSSAEDGDVGAVLGIGFPPHLGGPFRYMDRQGIDWVVDSLDKLAASVGPRYRPPDNLRQMLVTNQKFY
jgi:3-hydroxyacyl-CoA dehydrogenase/enoyl-CoA hydratase/3-hydroxybutyryl-CoA epimerase